MNNDQGSEYAGFIKEELASEVDRRDAVNTRAGAAITSATGLVTLVLAVVAITKGKDYVLTGAAVTALVVALFALLLSAVAAILAGLSWKHKALSITSMRVMLQSRWGTPEVDARNQTAFARVVTIESLRRATNTKFKFLIAAGVGQVVAILALSVTIILTVLVT